MFRRVMMFGGIAFGETYVSKDWETDDLPAVLRFFLNNYHELSEKKLQFLKPLRRLGQVLHYLQGNSIKGSKSNISAHYNLSNDLFSLFLDKSMTYSSALFETKDTSLNKAQKNKLQSIVKKAKITSKDKVLEIGSGWGSFALEAAGTTNCTVDTLTLSEEQLRVVNSKIKEAKLDHLIKPKLCDYRKAQGAYDKIVSIEMLEAVGHKYLPTFFNNCSRLLKDDGVLVLQFIAYPDKYYKEYLTRQDWIQKYIFPGSHLPSLGALLEAANKNSDFVVESIDNYSEHYALTLAEWRKRFNAKEKEVSELNFDDNFKRSWNFYLASCEAEFDTRWLGLYQIVLTRPNNTKLNSLRHSSVLTEVKTAYA